MSLILETVFAIFAAVGFYLTLHTFYELLFVRTLRSKCAAELTLYGDGSDPASEHLMRTALHIRKQYFPELSITFVEIGTGEGQNIARHMAAKQDIVYQTMP